MGRHRLIYANYLPWRLYFFYSEDGTNFRGQTGTGAPSVITIGGHNTLIYLQTNGDENLHPIIVAHPGSK